MPHTRHTKHIPCITYHTHYCNTPHTHTHPTHIHTPHLVDNVPWPDTLDICFPSGWRAGDSDAVWSEAVSHQNEIWLNWWRKNFLLNQEVVDPPSLLKTQPRKKYQFWMLLLIIYKSLLFESWTGRKRIKEANKRQYLKYSRLKKNLPNR